VSRYPIRRSLRPRGRDSAEGAKAAAVKVAAVKVVAVKVAEKAVVGVEVTKLS
jgi:hypothetical protein